MTTRYKTDDSCVAAPSLRLSCLLCGGEDCVRLWEATDKKFHGQGRFRYVTCLACALVFLNPRPDDEELKQYYPDHVTTVTANGAGPWRQRVRQWLKRGSLGYNPLNWDDDDDDDDWDDDDDDWDDDE